MTEIMQATWFLLSFALTGPQDINDHLQVMHQSFTTEQACLQQAKESPKVANPKTDIAVMCVRGFIKRKS